MRGLTLVQVRCGSRTRPSGGPEGSTRPSRDANVPSTPSKATSAIGEPAGYAAIYRQWHPGRRGRCRLFRSPPHLPRAPLYTGERQAAPEVTRGCSAAPNCRQRASAATAQWQRSADQPQPGSPSAVGRSAAGATQARWAGRGHRATGTTYGKESERASFVVSGVSPELMPVLTASDIITSGTLSANVRPLTFAKP